MTPLTREPAVTEKIFLSVKPGKVYGLDLTEIGDAAGSLMADQATAVHGSYIIAIYSSVSTAGSVSRCPSTQLL